MAELTIGLMLSLLARGMSPIWSCTAVSGTGILGRRIAKVTLGIIGTGRVGARVLRRIASFGTPRVLANDLNPDPKLIPELKLEWVGKNEIYRWADVTISITFR